MQINTPVALVLFNRPKPTEIVFGQIAKAKPNTLFLIADGPRIGRAEDRELCRIARDIVQKITWPCEVHKNFSEVNLGCRKRFSTGLNWVFEQVEDAIILEDDTEPNLSFFSFCQDLLSKYKNDDRVMHIGGACFIRSNMSPQESYYFSRYAHSWGWATWRRAWKKYDEQMKMWNSGERNVWLNSYFQSRNAARYWNRILDLTSSEKIDSWAYRWMLSCWQQNSLSIVPKRNLVSHIGSGPEATHIKEMDNMTNDIKSFEIDFPLIHPNEVVRNVMADTFVEKNIFRIRGPLGRAMMKVNQILGRPN